MGRVGLGWVGEGWSGSEWVGVGRSGSEWVDVDWIATRRAPAAPPYNGLVLVPQPLHTSAGPCCTHVNHLPFPFATSSLLTAPCSFGEALDGYLLPQPGSSLHSYCTSTVPVDLEALSGLSEPVSANQSQPTRSAVSVSQP